MTLSAKPTSRFDLKELNYLFLMATFMLFAIRDGLTGSIRYLFEMLHLQFLWFVPDLMSFAALGLFFYTQFFVRKNLVGMYFIYLFLLSLFVSVFFMNDNLFSLFSSVKMFIPMVVGFCFYNRSVTERRWARGLLLFLCFSSTIGLILNPYIDYPWFGQTITSFGLEREATKLWWQEGGVRYGGLAGDSTMAAYMVVFVYSIVAPHYGLRFNLICLPFLYWGVDTSTSKTALGVLIIYYTIYIVNYFLRDPRTKLTLLRVIAKGSFLCLLAPIFLMIFFQGANLGEISSSLFSLQDRIDNTWPTPFAIIADIFPAGILFGCGLGCYSYPMDYTSMGVYNLPLDNFYLTNLIMIGPAFVPFVIAQFITVRYARDPVKLTLMSLFNFYSVTIQCYGPSYATLMFGYAFSEMFGHKPREEATQPIVAKPKRLRGSIPDDRRLAGSV